MAEMQYTFRNEPVNTVRRTNLNVPPELATALDNEWRKQVNDGVISVIDLPNAKAAAEFLVMAKVWGMSKTEGSQITVRKGQNKAERGDKDGTLRLIMAKYDANAPKRGRKPSGK
jgi:hypothetical protein